jgi:amino acid transporter
VHPTKKFPHVSLLVLGGVAFLFSLLFRLGEVISGILAMRILVQFIGQSIGLMLLHKKRKEVHFPFKMPFFPVPIILAILMWLFIFFSTGASMIITGLVVIALGVVAYLLKATLAKEWPFEVKPSSRL